MTIYILTRIKKLAFFEGAATQVNGLLLKVDLHGSVPLSELHMQQFYVLEKQLGKHSTDFDDPKLERYLDIHFTEKLIDWNQLKEEDMMTTIRHEAK
jgi:hypothetical protein